MSAETEPTPDVGNKVERLVAKTSRLRWLGMAIACLTAVNVVIAIARRSDIFGQFPNVPEDIAQLVPYFGLLTIPTTMILLYLWDTGKNSGRGLFEEISDYYEWRHRTDHGAPAVSESTRLALRNFLAHSTLPLAPFASGLLFYGVLNVALIILSRM